MAETMKSPTRTLFKSLAKLYKQANRILNVLDYDWQTAKTQRQKMLAVRNRAIFLLLLESGMLEELARLRLEDIELQRQRVTVRLGKMGKSRLSEFGPQTKKALWKYLSLRPHDVDPEAL